MVRDHMSTSLQGIMASRLETSYQDEIATLVPKRLTAEASGKK